MARHNSPAGKHVPQPPVEPTICSTGCTLPKSTFYLRILGAVFGAILLIVLLLPTLFSSEWGKKWILSKVNNNASGTVEIGNLSLAWFGGQKANQITVKDPDGRIVATVDNLKTDISPLTLAFRSTDIGNTEITGLHAYLVQDGKGVSNLHRAFAPAAITASAVTDKSNLSSGKINLQVPFSGHLSIKDASVALSGPDMDLVSFDKIVAVIDSDLSKGCATAKVQGLSHQDELSGHFAVEGALQGLDAEGRLALLPNSTGIPLPIENQGLVRLKLDIENASVDVFDQLLTIGNPKLTGILSEALGSTLNLRLDTVLTRSGPSVQIAGDSKHMHAELITEVRDGKLILEKAGKVSFQVSPDLFKRVALIANPAQQPLFALKQDLNINLEFDRMTLPTRLSSQDAQPTVRLKIGLNDAILIGQGSLGEVKLHNVSGLLERLEASGAFVLSLNGSVTQGNQTGTLRLGSKLLDGSQGDAGISDLVLTAKNIPTAVVDYIAQAENVLNDTIGPNFDLQAKARLSGKNASAELQIGSDSLAAPSILFDLHDGVALAQPAQVQLYITPTLLHYILGAESSINLEDRTSVLLTLNELSFPTAGKASINMEAATAPFILSGFVSPNNGRLRFSNFKSRISGQPEQLSYVTTTDVAPDGVTPMLTAGLGNVASLTVEGSIKNNAVAETRISLQSELLDFRSSFHLNDGVFALTTPATLRYNAKPELLLSLGLIEPGAPHFIQKTPLELRIEQLAWNPKTDGGFPSFAQGKIAIGQMDIVDTKTAPIASLRDASISWNYDGAEYLAGIIMRAKYEHEGEQGSLNATVDLSGWQSHQNAIVKADVNVEKLPVAFISAATGKNGWQKLLGETVDFCGRANYEFSQKDTPGTLQASFHAADLQGSLVMALGDSTAFARNTQPVIVTWNATPERAEAAEELLEHYGYATPLPWKLAQPTTIHATLNQFTLPWHSRQGIVLDGSSISFWDSPSLEGKLSADNVVLVDRDTQEKTTLEQVALTFDSPSIAKTVNFAFATKESAAELKREPSTLAIAGTLEGLKSANGWFETHAMKVHAALEAKELALTDILRYPLQRASASRHIAGLIGERVGGTLNLDFVGHNGTINAQFLGQSGSFKLNGQIDNEILTLNEPMALELQVTPQLRQGLLKDLAPYMAAARSTDQPVRFTIDPKGFAFPLQTSNFQAMKVPRATLDLGKVELENNSPLGTIVSILQADRKLTDTTSIWFTPLNMSIYDGLIRFDRMDALVANRFPIAMWGKIDLMKDRVRLVVGLTAQALKEAYGLNNLANNYVLQIPFTGTIDNPVIDKAKTTTRVTALVAQAHGSREGVVFGGVLDLLSGAGHEDSVPPPSGQAPWAPTDQEQTTTPHNPNQAGIIGDELQKNLKKGAKKLLDSFK
ncbi:MAG: AsmA family protein [Chlamydiales bacterium]|nr:AsmA family protein [Chlamydiales bacterium]